MHKIAKKKIHSNNSSSSTPDLRKSIHRVCERAQNTWRQCWRQNFCRTWAEKCDSNRNLLQIQNTQIQRYWCQASYFSLNLCLLSPRAYVFVDVDVAVVIRIWILYTVRQDIITVQGKTKCNIVSRWKVCSAHTFIEFPFAFQKWQQQQKTNLLR